MILGNMVCVTKVARLSSVINHETWFFHFSLYDFNSIVFGFTLLKILFGSIPSSWRKGSFSLKLEETLTPKWTQHEIQFQRHEGDGEVWVQWCFAIRGWGCHYRLLTCEKASNGTLNSLFTMISIWLKEESFKVELRDLIKVQVTCFGVSCCLW